MSLVGHVPLSMISQGFALVWIVWSFFILVLQCIGTSQLFRYHSSPARKPISPSLPEDEVPHITIIRPVKGWEAGWYDCLAASFLQAYPREKMTIYLCVASARDPSFPHLQRLVDEFRGFDARILVEEQDPVLHGSSGSADNLGPNPKIRNMSRAYREARGDVVWVVDANVWVSKGAAGRMVDRLFGYSPDGARKKPYKFVHQLPLVIDITRADNEEAQSLVSHNPVASPGDPPGNGYARYTHDPPRSHGPHSLMALGGGLLEEMFMSTSHAKFYSAINTAGVAPCIVGKSNMFRKSHLDRFTDPSQNPILSAADASRGRGIDFFSSNICEDHLIGDLLWRSRLSGFSNHSLVSGDLAIQPAADMSVADYIARRVRWLRVRKWTVLAATLVEPGVESLLCCFYFAFALTTLPWPHRALGLPQTWPAAAAVWLAAVSAWVLVDRAVYCKLHKCQAVEVDEDTPSFARGTGRAGPRPFLPWLGAWLGREVLALPIWTWAVLLGATVTWRGKSFKVRMDMTVVEIPSPESAGNGQPARPPSAEPSARSKDHTD